MMRLILAICYSWLATSNAFAQTPDWAIEPEFQAAGTFYKGLAPIKIDEKWGFIDEKGKWALLPAYEKLKPYRGGLIGIFDGENWGYVDHTSKTIAPLKFQDVATSQENRGSLKGGNGKWNLIDETGNQLVDFIYESAPVFSEGFAPVKLDGQWGFINKDGKNFQAIVGAKRLFRLSEGLAVFVEGDKRGYVNAKGEKAIPATYHRARRFSGGKAAVSTGEGANWTLINKEQDILFASEPQFMVREFSEGMVPVQTLTDPAKWTFVDSSGFGKENWEGPFDAAYSFKGGYALVKKDGQFNFIGTNGKYVSKVWFDDGYAFNEGLAPVKFDGQWGYISNFSSKFFVAGYDIRAKRPEVIQGVRALLKNQQHQDALKYFTYSINRHGAGENLVENFAEPFLSGKLNCGRLDCQALGFSSSHGLLLNFARRSEHILKLIPKYAASLDFSKPEKLRIARTFANIDNKHVRPALVALGYEDLLASEKQALESYRSKFSELDKEDVDAIDAFVSDMKDDVIAFDLVRIEHANKLFELAMAQNDGTIGADAKKQGLLKACSDMFSRHISRSLWPEIRFREGVCLYHRLKVDDAIYALKYAATHKYSDAYLQLFLIYSGNDPARGILVDDELKAAKDEKYALSWLEKAAEAEDSEGMVIFAFKKMEAGEGDEAINWLEKAATLNHPMAQTVLGGIYAEGLKNDKVDIAADKTRAIMWLKKAADQGSRKAKRILVELDK